MGTPTPTPAPGGSQIPTNIDFNIDLELPAPGSSETYTLTDMQGVPIGTAKIFAGTTTSDTSTTAGTSGQTSSDASQLQFVLDTTNPDAPTLIVDIDLWVNGANSHVATSDTQVAQLNTSGNAWLGGNYTVALQSVWDNMTNMTIANQSVQIKIQLSALKMSFSLATIMASSIISAGQSEATSLYTQAAMSFATAGVTAATLAYSVKGEVGNYGLGEKPTLEDTDLAKADEGAKTNPHITSGEEDNEEFVTKVDADSLPATKVPVAAKPPDKPDPAELSKEGLKAPADGEKALRNDKGELITEDGTPATAEHEQAATDYDKKVDSYNEEQDAQQYNRNVDARNQNIKLKAAHKKDLETWNKQMSENRQFTSNMTNQVSTVFSQTFSGISSLVQAQSKLNVSQQQAQQEGLKVEQTAVTNVQQAASQAIQTDTDALGKAIDAKTNMIKQASENVASILRAGH